jgi:hypothetical protein
MRGLSPLLVAGFVVLIGAAAAMPAGAADRPIVGTDRLARPADAAPLEPSRKRFLKAEPSRAPRLSAKPDGVSPILPPLALKGHRESPPQTTAPLKPGRAPVNPPPVGTQVLGE